MCRHSALQQALSSDDWLTRRHCNEAKNKGVCPHLWDSMGFRAVHHDMVDYRV